METEEWNANCHRAYVIGVDLDTVWEVAKKDLIVLQKSIQPFLSKTNGSELKA